MAAWNASTSLLEMLQTLEGAPEGLDFWSYKLIDAQRLELEELVGADSPLLGLFSLEQLNDVGDLGPVAAELQATLGPEEGQLAAAFVTFINEAVLPFHHGLLALYRKPASFSGRPQAS